MVGGGDRVRRRARPLLRHVSVTDRDTVSALHQRDGFAAELRAAHVPPGALHEREEVPVPAANLEDAPLAGSPHRLEAPQPVRKGRVLQLQFECFTAQRFGVVVVRIQQAQGRFGHSIDEPHYATARTASVATPTDRGDESPLGDTAEIAIRCLFPVPPLPLAERLPLGDVTVDPASAGIGSAGSRPGTLATGNAARCPRPSGWGRAENGAATSPSDRTKPDLSRIPPNRASLGMKSSTEASAAQATDRVAGLRVGLPSVAGSSVRSCAKFQESFKRARYRRDCHRRGCWRPCTASTTMSLPSGRKYTA